MFSDYFDISPQVLKDYGTVNISLIADLPLFIDPILIFNSQKEEYKILHKKIIRYLHFLSDKAKLGLNKSEIKTWFTFNEICNNWFGFSLKGNKGSALNTDFAKKLHDNISFVLDNNNISSGHHMEKIMLIHPGSGKDRISDMTVNMIKGFLCEYTQEFAKKHITKNAKLFYVDKADFNYETECFVSKEYYLPYILNEKNKEEYVLLTPKDILRREEPAINRDSFLTEYNTVRNAISNDELRSQLSNYIAKSIREYHDQCDRKDLKPKASQEKRLSEEAFEEFSKKNPIIYDYFIKLKERDSEIINSLAEIETDEEMIKFIENVKVFTKVIDNNKHLFNKSTNSFEEAKMRVEWFRHVIENQDLYKNFYNPKTGDRLVKYEEELQRMFRLTWMQSAFKPDDETNKGRGPADLVVSYGSTDVCVVEFKLANNNQLEHIFKQIDVYKAANKAKHHIAVIFHFDDNEKTRVLKILNDLGKISELENSIYLIDCSKRLSASKVK